MDVLQMLQQLGNHFEIQDEEEMHHTKWTMAAMLFDQGRYNEAIVLEEEILAYSRRTHPVGHVNIGVALTNLAISYRDHGRCHDALPMFFEALSIYEQELAPNHHYIGREFGNIGACYQAMRCPADCLRMHKRALQWRRQHYSPLKSRGI
jgi:tetratricopeptide (TPR) repeat protein